MMPSRHASEVRAPSPAAGAAGLDRMSPVPVVLALAPVRRFRGRLRRLAVPAPAAFRERIVRELRGGPPR
jgi:hypothetical protein